MDDDDSNQELELLSRVKSLAKVNQNTHDMPMVLAINKAMVEVIQEEVDARLYELKEFMIFFGSFSENLLKSALALADVAASVQQQVDLLSDQIKLELIDPYRYAIAALNEKLGTKMKFDLNTKEVDSNISTSGWLSAMARAKDQINSEYGSEKGSE